MQAQLKEALEKNAVLGEELKVKMDEHQLEMRTLKEEVNAVERSKDAINQEIKEQETILRNFIDTLKTRSREIDRAQKNIVLKEKACALIQDLKEKQLKERQKRVDLAVAKVIKPSPSAHCIPSDCLTPSLALHADH